MRFAGVRAVFAFSLFFLGICAGRGIAAEEAEAGQIQSQLEEIKNRIAALESEQQNVLAQKDKILESIDQVRVWARHNGGG